MTKKTLIAVPAMDYVAAGFAASLAMLQKDGEALVSFICGSLIYDARNKLAAQAIKLEADYIMWFDSDMTFQPDTMRRLFKTMEDKTPTSSAACISDARHHIRPLLLTKSR